jgi:CDP-glucose 4,6-dehydratase
MSRKRILITGHTGFKGTWLSLVLGNLGYEVYGYSLEAQYRSLHTQLKQDYIREECISDIRNFEKLNQYVKKISPDYVFHLAAQPLVLESYKNPRETFDVNITGTSNLLDSAFNNQGIEAIGVVTTDKVYRNDNNGLSFVETDALSGKDPYSASKVGAEAVTAAWQNISNQKNGPKIVSLRAGNVIGGGDMALDRLLPDLIRSFETGGKIFVRNPNSTRPWQHVLDPISGYIAAVIDSKNYLSPAYNFSPNGESLKVSEVVDIAAKAWGYAGEIEVRSDSDENYEAEKLHLNSDLAKKELNWKPKWDQEQAIVSTIEWWKKVLIMKKDPREACLIDLDKALA